MDNGSLKVNQECVIVNHHHPDEVRKVKISKLRAYVSLDDWFTFTKYPGLDPETSAYQSAANGIGVDYGSYPISKKFVFGVNISF